jgi:hypothetical protein
MIHLGLRPDAKRATIDEYRRAHGIAHTVMLTPGKFDFQLDASESIDWPEIIMYRTFYRLLQEVGAASMVIVNECLRTQNRNDLTYNCIRHILNQAGHVLVFQWFPLIDTMDDFMVLFDFATRSRWRRARFDPDLRRETEVRVTPRPIRLTAHAVAVDAKTRATYQTERAALFAGIDGKDPHTIPRRLHLIGGAARAQGTDPWRWAVGRNNRFKLARLQTYKEDAYPNAPYDLLDFPHHFIDLSDVLALSGQQDLMAMVTELAVDQWYFARFGAWTRRIEDAYADLSQG